MRFFRLTEQIAATIMLTASVVGAALGLFMLVHFRMAAAGLVTPLTGWRI